MKLLGDVDREHLTGLLSRFGLRLVETAPDEPIPGSYWGESEAGLVGNTIHARADTPIHSILHETSHYVCMTASRRASLLRDAGGDDREESAVCCLQILLSDRLPGMGRARVFLDMDDWGYSFRLGSTEAWFEDNSEDARAWLVAHGLIDRRSRSMWKLREGSCDNE
ncbi:MAG: hypothetical protein ACRD1Z_18505 [Vicinamibacteria bacterium]